MTIVKDDIISEVMTNLSLDRKPAKHLVESILRSLKDKLASGNDVLISGFGEFKVRHKKARIGRNPKTMVEYEISERKVVTFYPSKVFRKEMK
jgi:integration host factor subunit alpha